MNEKILYDTPYKFKIKTVYTSSRYIMIGVTDYSKQKDLRSSYSSGNSVCYHGYNATIYGPNSSQGGGFNYGWVV